MLIMVLLGLASFDRNLEVNYSFGRVIVFLYSGDLVAIPVCYFAPVVCGRFGVLCLEVQYKVFVRLNDYFNGDRAGLRAFPKANRIGIVKLRW